MHLCNWNDVRAHTFVCVSGTSIGTYLQHARSVEWVFVAHHIICVYLSTTTPPLSTPRILVTEQRKRPRPLRFVECGQLRLYTMRC